jgi:hypothetical protein
MEHQRSPAWRRAFGWLLTTAALTAATAVSAGISVFQTPPPDPRAFTVAGQGDGRTDDTEAIQHSLDAATEHSPGGVVFLPSGRYLISHTLLVSPGVRIFGIGATRPASSAAWAAWWSSREQGVAIPCARARDPANRGCGFRWLMATPCSS